MIQTRAAHEVMRRRHPAWAPDGPAMWITSYLGHDAGTPKDVLPPPPDVLFPCAYVIDHDAGVAGPAHYHEANEFQIVIAGSGRFGKKPIARGTVHYAGAYSPYGPIVGGDDGLSYMTLRDTYSQATRKMPESRALLRAAAAKPHSVVAAYEPAGEDALCALALPERFEIIAPLASGLTVACYRLPPDASVTGDAPGGGGAFWLVTAGTQVLGGGLVSAPTCTFVSADESPYRVQAGPAGLEILMLQFPLREPKETTR